METEPPSLFFLGIIISSLLSGISSAFTLLFLLLGSALISGSEVAYFSLSKKKLEIAKQEKSKGIDLILQLLSNKAKLLATILIANNFINIAIVLLSAYLSKLFIHPILGNLIWLGFDWVFVFDLVVITSMLLFFGEIIPKIYARRNPLGFADFMTKPLRNLIQVFTPFSFILLKLSQSLEKQLKKNSSISLDELSQALELTSEDNTTTQEEQKILEGIVTFGNTETVQIMTPRVDVFALSTETSYDEVLKTVAQNGYSRIPIYENQIDEIKGILYVKDLIPYLEEKYFDWNEILRKAFFVPETKKLNDLLADFQEKKIHLAVVVDEYGGTSGVVSLEDVIEEIVGDISDEFDDDHLSYSRLDEQNYIFEGKTPLKDVTRILELKDDFFETQKGEAETLAGLMLELSDSYPKKRQTINLKTMSFTIESVDKKRIKSIKVSMKYNNEE